MISADVVGVPETKQKPVSSKHLLVITVTSCNSCQMSTMQIKTMKGYVTITVSSFTQVSGVIQVVIMILGSKRPKYSDDLVFVGKPLMFK